MFDLLLVSDSVRLSAADPISSTSLSSLSWVAAGLTEACLAFVSLESSPVPTASEFAGVMSPLEYPFSDDMLAEEGWCRRTVSATTCSENRVSAALRGKDDAHGEDPQDSAHHTIC